MTSGRPRRTFVEAAAAAAARGLHSWRVEPHRVGVVHRPMPRRRRPPQLVGRTLLPIGDLHVGPAGFTG